jgi:hypothetical protein
MINKDDFKKYLALRIQRECRDLGITDTNAYVLSIGDDQKAKMAAEIVGYMRQSAEFASLVRG